MSTWRCKVDDGEIGPIAFQELADLLREGKIGEQTRVRREGAANWEPAWNVVGLMEAARREPPATGSGDYATTERTSARPRDAPGHRLGSARATGGVESGPGILANSATLARVAAAGLVALAATALVHRWVYWKTMIFPPPRDGGAAAYWFPLLGECSALEYALAYVDLFAVAAVVAWWLCGPLATRLR